MADLDERAEAHLVAARGDERGRSAELLVRDGPLRQTVIALTAGSVLEEHNTPDAASIQVLRGRVRITGPQTIEMGAGDLQTLAHDRHGVLAIQDAVLLLTAVTGVGPTGGPERAR
ncbi:cupin [Georgenia alba]|uniref:Cupin n=1 Tax=Georgenia alba TaxID=2233858 RepID=A0ABW2Q1Z0_9MICO